MNSYCPAIVLSDWPDGGLGAARALARRGVDVTVIAIKASDPILYSRYPSKTYVAGGSTQEKRESRLLEILRQLPDQDAVILTASDRLVALISDHRQELQGKYQFSIPSQDVLNSLNDKCRETELVKSLGFPIPKTVQVLPSDPDTLSQQLGFPIIFKPHSYAAKEVFPHKNLIVQNREELNEFYQRWKFALPVLLAQEIILGPDSHSWICSCTFDKNSELLDCAIKQKLRSSPIHFGGSCFAVSRTNPEIVSMARELGKQLKHVGHAGIEFRWDQRDEVYKYIELNPRIPQNVCFDEACGLPTVWNSYKVSQAGDHSGSGKEQKEGIYYLALTDDIWSQLGDRISIVGILYSYLKLFFRKTNGPYFAWDDPMPGIVVGYRFVDNVCHSLFRKLRRRAGTS